MIPLVHDLEGERVLVFGGGTVGARKARRFAREADVVVVSPTFADTDFGGADLARVAPTPGEVERWVAESDPALVVAATDDRDVNDAVEAAALDRGILVNRADRSGDRDVGSVVVPATVRSDPVVVAVGTGGRSPALSRYLREEIEGTIEAAGPMADLAAGLKEDLRGAGVPATDRREALRAVVRSEAVWKALDSPSNNAQERATNVITDVIGEFP